MKLNRAAASLLCCLTPMVAMATDGYFSDGYGMTAKGMGGAATATSKDSFGGANNPAAMVWAGSRLDAGLDFFSPKRDVSRAGSSGFATGMDGTASSGSNMFYIPEFGYNRMLGADRSIGITVYGNGGMNTDFPGGQIPAVGTACGSQAGGFNQASGQAGPYNLLCGSGKLGIDMSQLILAPTFAMKVGNNNSFGASLLIGYQQFKANGLSAFYSFSPSGATPYATGNKLTDLGYDSSHGVGFRLGWMGKVSDTVSLGAAYSGKMKMSAFSKYQDLFAGQGKFDLPENYNLGIAFKASPSVNIAADFQRINYDGVPSVGNPSTNGGAVIGGTTGCAGCRGFGWSGINVFKLGLEYQHTPNLVLRAGYNHSDNPIQARDVTFNIIAPGVIKDHLTLGMTYSVSKASDLTLAYMHAFKNSVSGPSLFNNWLGDNATEKIQLSEDSIGIAYSIKF